MSNLTLPTTPQWNESINQVETTESILGGANGNANLAAKQLAENILWLKKQLEDRITESIKVGDIYTTTIGHTNAAAVATHHGYGTWVRFAEGRTLVGFSTNITDAEDYKTIGNEFGANTHKLTIAESPSHKHSQNDIYNKFMARASDSTAVANGGVYVGSSGTGVTGNGFDNDNIANEYQTGQMSAKGWVDSTEQRVGSDQPHNNIQPSVVAAYWLRTA